MATYTNRPISKACQLAELKNRGLVVGDDNQAIEHLGSINYFRFACYLQPFEIDHATHQYAAGTSFDQIIELYQFDKELRSLIFTAIQDVEIALRSRIIHHFSMSHGTFWFLNRNMFKDKSIFNTTLQKEWNEVNRSKEDFIQDFFDRYDNPILPPVWKTLEVASFGVLSKTYENFAEVSVKKFVAKDFGLPQYTYLESWIRSITVLRNCCAHHARTWNRRYPWKPKMPATLPLNWISNAPAVRKQKLYAQLCCLAYMCQTIVSTSDFKGGLKALLAKYPKVNPTALGFPPLWDQEPLWR